MFTKHRWNVLNIQWHHGRRKVAGGPKPPWILKSKKGHFLSFEWVNANNRAPGNTTIIYCIDILMLENWEPVSSNLLSCIALP